MATNNNPEDDNSGAYDSGHIKVLKGLEAVRTRPGMYIGDTDDEQGSGLHHMIAEVVHNSVDEALVGYCDKIVVELCEDGSVKVSDDGRGIPIDVHEEEGVPAAELIMTVLHAGGKFNQNAYKVSGGLHGVGVSVVNALSDWLKLEVKRDGQCYTQMYERGEPGEPVIVPADTENEGTGTMVQFLASDSVFSHINYSRKTVIKNLRELAFLNRGIHIHFIDSRDHNDYFSEDYHYEGGVSEFVVFLNESKTELHEDVISVSGEQDGISFELAMQWTSAYQEHIFCYTNNIPQPDGGTHLSALKTSLTRTINKYASDVMKNKQVIQGDDVREGLTAVLSIKMADPKFSSQTKAKLVSSEVKKGIEGGVCDHLLHYLEEKPKIADIIIKKIEEAARARDAARKARDLSRKSDQIGLDVKLSSKLSPCQEKDPSKIEVCIVEGDSAGGSAKQGRDRRFQAILPLRGKILNVEKARYDKVLSSEQIATLIMALGCGVGKEEYDPDKLRYHKVIIMTDADVDGAHIRTLLLTFFYRQMPEILERGHIYIAQPPLYRLRKGKSDCYLKDDDALYDFLLNDVMQKGSLGVGKETVATGQALKEIVIAYHHAKDAVTRRYPQLPYALFLAMMQCRKLSIDDFESEGVLKSYCKLYNAQAEGLFEGQNKAEAHVRSGMIEVDYIQANGEKTQFIIDMAFVRSSIYASIGGISKVCGPIFAQSEGQDVQVDIVIDATTHTVSRVDDLVVYVMNCARKGYTLQRYKGLGEMDAEQLWETTLDPDVRTLVQVTIEDAIEADRLFSMLMGDVVEPRKEFIEKNALMAENVDA